MSHLSLITTKIKNFKILKKSLNDLNLNWITDTKENVLNNTEFDISNIDLIVFDKNNNFLFGFNWNINEYNLVTDLSLWNASCSIDKVVQKLNQQYAINVILEETLKHKFQTISYSTNNLFNKQIICERWDI
jgi:hypothetical protein